MPTLLSPHSLNELLQNNTTGLRVLDCTYNVTPKPDPVKWRKENFGKFQELMKKDSPQKTQYLQAQIPTANFMDLDVAMYPSRFERLAHYEPEMFQEYMQLLGVNHGDQIVLYSRGPFAGMLFSAKCYWLLKVYGHTNVCILDGGFDAWKKAGFEVESRDILPDVERGNWMPENFRHRLITFEELTEKDSDGKDIFEMYQNYNILDARMRAQFNNEQNTTFNPSVVPGSHIPGTQNSPVNELINQDGQLLDIKTIKERLAESHFDPKKPTITLCTSGIQASLLATTIELAYPKANIRVFNGSLKEMEARAPQRISGGIKPVNAF